MANFWRKYQSIIQYFVNVFASVVFYDVDKLQTEGGL